MSRPRIGFGLACIYAMSFASLGVAAPGRADEWGSRGVYDGDVGTQADSQYGLSEARPWKQIEIPGATCGDGSPYSVFVSPGIREKLVMSFMGGGACWNYETCYGPLRLTWLKGVKQPRDRLGGIYSADPQVNAAADYSFVHFPYCTGDVHLGRHTNFYQGEGVHHVGANNIDRAMVELEKQGLIQPAQTEELVVYGYSAGAIGALYHADALDKKFVNASRKTLLSDAPGLHFGPRFWGKFTPELRHDYSEAMKVMGYALDPKQGMIADLVSKVCAHLPGWQVGVLQGSADVVMSAVFGNITPWEHDRLIFGAGGLWEMGKVPGDNCTVWIPRSPMHTFLVADLSAQIRAAGVNAWLFSRDRMEHRGDRSYRD